MGSVRLVLAGLLLISPLGAQFGAPPPPDVLLVGRFRTPLSYDAALAQLDSYYQEEVGRKLASRFRGSLPASTMSPGTTCGSFSRPQGNGQAVAIERPTDAATGTLAKGWMLQLAGRINGEMPLQFEEEPALQQTGGEIYGSRHDLARGARIGAQPCNCWRPGSMPA